ncbi:MAG: branched-chain amino acid ABC transporter permease, partial [Fimbriimonas ginsengisoli]|nr:branched-chain amino acid ABC transporter permease [Fimbriimonas ginsengisoli]
MPLSLQLLAGVDFHTLPQQVVNGIMLGAIYALIALGYTMVYGVLKLINFAHGEVYMLGAYVALFASWRLGFTPEATRGTNLQSSAFNLVILLLASMAICALIGVIIERFAYRPMRQHARIASLITAIGVSMFLQFGGALVLPISPEPNVSGEINPYKGTYQASLTPSPTALVRQRDAAKQPYEAAQKTFDEYIAATHEDRFNLSPKGIEARDLAQQAERTYKDLESKVESAGVSVIVPKGQLVMLVTAVFLMLLLRHLVMRTRAGRAMRAVSHDFDSAALMGVNVNRIVVLTFVLGSSMAGAGAMMTATFLGTPLTTFYGM